MSTKTTPQHRNSSSNAVNSPSPSSRRSHSTPSTPIVRGPLLSSLETSYHKRLRTILQDHKKLRREWNELVLRGCLARSRAVLELWTDVEIGIKFLEKNKELSVQKVGVKAGYLFQQSSRLSDQIGTIAAVVASLMEVLSSMKQLVDRVESLVIEAATAKGTAFAFREPLWVTWPLSRFSEGIQDLTSYYSPSLSLIQTLLETLTTFPPLPSETDKSEPRPIGEIKERPSSEELQAAMSLLAVQPLIPGKGGEGGPEAWEEICVVEVGGWSESR